MSEKLYERKLRERVYKAHGLAIKIYSPAFTGLPDRFILLPVGRLWIVEVKSPGKKPTQRQETVHNLLEKIGFKPLIIDSENSLQEFFKTAGI